MENKIGAYVAGDIRAGSAPPPVPLRNDPRFRALVYQLALLALALWFGYAFALNAKANLQAQQITTGFGLLANSAGFGVTQSLIAYHAADTSGRAVFVGLVKTLLVPGTEPGPATL